MNEDPARLTHGMDESFDHDELVAALIDNIIADPEGVHRVRASESTGSPAMVEVEFNNQVGQTCHVDGILETLTMKDWRKFCEDFTNRVCAEFGFEADIKPEDWILPSPAEVVMIPEDYTDVITTVRIKWHVQYRAYCVLRRFAELKNANTQK